MFSRIVIKTPIFKQLNKLNKLNKPNRSYWVASESSKQNNYIIKYEVIDKIESINNKLLSNSINYNNIYIIKQELMKLNELIKTIKHK